MCVVGTMRLYRTADICYHSHTCLWHDCNDVEMNYIAILSLVALLDFTPLIFFFQSFMLLNILI